VGVRTAKNLPFLIPIILPNYLHYPTTMGDYLSEQASKGIRVSNSRELLNTAEIYSKQLIQLLLHTPEIALILQIMVPETLLLKMGSKDHRNTFDLTVRSLKFIQ
jgi:hypothetical protein